MKVEEHYVGTEIDPRTQLSDMRKFGISLAKLGWLERANGHLHCLPGYKTWYDNVNLITICENTEGEYSGLEHQVVRGVVESLKIITRQASLRVAEYAFHYAKEHGGERVSAIHKANIMQKTDGLFLKCCHEVAEKYPEIKYEEVVIDNCCMMSCKTFMVTLLVTFVLFGWGFRLDTKLQHWRVRYCTS
ncbi:3-isopropylmalate dehydrogenase, chloroplastic [Stylosanthes scabra]|uniref:3-isopropylmalate dehydrogenase, chloroplastic n=1 Tax=Stylosanthes scabra TaxID=79078 RepID=A0ABU6WS34_9FABA|nr:3-isopropylmalate dehydrogenase, chloroplastic [Stylosanthes scabra]